MQMHVNASVSADHQPHSVRMDEWMVATAATPRGQSPATTNCVSPDPIQVGSEHKHTISFSLAFFFFSGMNGFVNALESS